jgi:hypothetical protein
MPNVPRLDPENPMTQTMRELLEQRDKMQDELEDAYQRADIAEIELEEIRAAAKNVLASEEDAFGLHGRPHTYDVDPLRRFVDPSMTTPETGRGQRILQMLDFALYALAEDHSTRVQYGHVCGKDGRSTCGVADLLAESQTFFRREGEA